MSNIEDRLAALEAVTGVTQFTNKFEQLEGELQSELESRVTDLINESVTMKKWGERIQRAEDEAESAESHTWGMFGEDGIIVQLMERVEKLEKLLEEK